MYCRILGGLLLQSENLIHNSIGVSFYAIISQFNDIRIKAKFHKFFNYLLERFFSHLRPEFKYILKLKTLPSSNSTIVTKNSQINKKSMFDHNLLLKPMYCELISDIDFVPFRIMHLVSSSLRILTMLSTPSSPCIKEYATGRPTKT